MEGEGQLLFHGKLAGIGDDNLQSENYVRVTSTDRAGRPPPYLLRSLATLRAKAFDLLDDVHSLGDFAKNNVSS